MCTKMCCFFCGRVYSSSSRRAEKTQGVSQHDTVLLVPASVIDLHQPQVCKCSQVADLKANIKGNVTVKADVKQLEDGLLEVTYAAPLTGEYRISLFVGSTAVHGSPFRMSCQQPRACEHHSRVCDSIEDAFVGEQYCLPLDTYDQFGKVFTGKADIQTDVLDGSTVLFQADVLELRPGKYEIAFTPKISGAYNLTVSFDSNRVLKGCPLVIRVRNDETCAANCKLYGAGLTQGVAGAHNVFSVQGKREPLQCSLQLCCLAIAELSPNKHHAETSMFCFAGGMTCSKTGCLHYVLQHATPKTMLAVSGETHSSLTCLALPCGLLLPTSKTTLMGKPVPAMLPAFTWCVPQAVCSMLQASTVSPWSLHCCLPSCNVVCNQFALC